MCDWISIINVEGGYETGICSFMQCSTSAGQFQTRQVMVGTPEEIRGIIGSLGQMRELPGVKSSSLGLNPGVKISVISQIKTRKRESLDCESSTCGPKALVCL